jgi:hypothetical protein
VVDGWNIREVRVRSASQSLLVVCLPIDKTAIHDEQYFSLTTNQSTIVSAVAYQPSEHGRHFLPVFSRV